MKPYSNQLFLTQTFSNGILNGRYIRYSSLVEEKYLCGETGLNNVNPLDTCRELKFNKEFQSAYYKNDILHGPCETRDSNDLVTFKGSFIDGKKDGLWLESFSAMSENKQFYYFDRGYYKGGERSGKWEQFISEDFVWKTFSYNNGKLDGEIITYNKNGDKREIKKYSNGEINEIIVVDSLESRIKRHYTFISKTKSKIQFNLKLYEKYKIFSKVDYIYKVDKSEINFDLFDAIFLLNLSNKLDDVSIYGNVTRYDENQEVISQGRLEDKSRIGVWLFNYYDQNVQVHMTYDDNGLRSEYYYFIDNLNPYNGAFTYFDENNQNKEVRKIKAGLRDGVTTYYDSLGNKTKVEKYKGGVLR